MPPDEEGEDLRSILSRVVDEAEAAAADPPIVPAKEPAGDAGGGEERARGPDGKFIPKVAAGEDDELGEKPAAEPIVPAEPSGEEPKPTIAEPAVEVPQHWSQSDKDLIAGLPKESQGAVVARMKRIQDELTPRLQEAAEIRRQYQGAMEIFQPHIDGLRQRGQTPSDVIRAWASIEQDLMQGRDLAAQGGVNAKGAEHVARIIKMYNVDPGAVASLLRGESLPNTGNGVPSAGYVPPELMQKIGGIEERLNAREAAEQTARTNSSQAQIDAFASEKDETGGLKYPYFSELERDMMALAQIDISQGKVPTIADLYDRAVYANRETRSKVLAASQAEATRKAAAERKAQAEKAARAASSITGSPGAGGSLAERQQPRSLRDEIAAAAAEVEAG